MLRCPNRLSRALLTLALPLSFLLSSASQAAPVVQAVQWLPPVAAASQPARAASRFANGFATDTAMADYVYAWAEKTYPQFFSPANPPSQTLSGYYFRYYSGTNAYLAEKDGDLWLLMNGSMQKVDSLSAFATQIGYKPGGGTGGGAMTVGKAVSIEFMRAVIQWQVDHGQYSDDFGNINYGGSSVSYGDLMSINVDMNAGKVYLSCYLCHNWSLSFEQYYEFATELEFDTYFTGAMTYMDNGDYNGYVAYTKQMAAQYATQAASIPASFSIYWK